MKVIFTESDFDSFKDFHDNQWFSDLFDLVNSSEIENEVEEFLTHWWGTSRAFVMPWLLVDGVYESINSIIPLVDKTKQDVWDEYLQMAAFRGALWKVTEGAFISIYYAYENLILNLLNKNQTQLIRVTDRKFNSILTERLGNNLSNRIWSDNFISVSREIRNCIVHRGGKVSEKLLKMNRLPQIENDNILISASDVRILYSNLKPRVVSLLQHYLSSNTQ